MKTLKREGHGVRYLGHRMKITSKLGYPTLKNYHSKLMEQLKIFYDKQKLKQYMTITSSLQKAL
jgi:hypothetical protein